MAEPGRDTSGYRRYTAHHVVELIKIRTLAEAGVPLADIRELTGGGDHGEFSARLDRVDRELTARIRRLGPGVRSRSLVTQARRPFGSG